MDVKDVFNESLFEKEVPVGMYRLSPEGQILKANQTLAVMLGYESPEGLVGSYFDCKIVFSPSAQAAFKQLLHWNKQVPDFISQWRKCDGSLLLVRETAWIIPGEEGEVLFYEGAANPVMQPIVGEKQI